MPKAKVGDHVSILHQGAMCGIVVGDALWSFGKGDYHYIVEIGTKQGLPNIITVWDSDIVVSN